MPLVLHHYWRYTLQISHKLRFFLNVLSSHRFWKWKIGSQKLKSRNKCPCCTMHECDSKMLLAWRQIRLFTGMLATHFSLKIYLVFRIRFNLARTMLELFKRKWSLRKESICMQVFDKLKEAVDEFPDSSVVLYDWAISGFFCAYGFSRTKTASKDVIGQQARDALSKALINAPALLSKLNGTQVYV